MGRREECETTGCRGEPGILTIGQPELQVFANVSKAGRARLPGNRHEPYLHETAVFVAAVSSFPGRERWKDGGHDCPDFHEGQH